MQKNKQTDVSYFNIFLVIFIALCYAACDPAFSPVKQNDRHFSVFGYLNASADTQFVRIEKLRDGKSGGSPESFDAEVTLTNVTTNQTVRMRDKVYEYYLQGKAHNFYTTMDINPKQKYRLEINGSEGESSAEVEIPDLFSEPEMVAGGKYKTDVKITGMERLVGVKTIFHTCLLKCNCKTTRRFSYSHLQDTLHMVDGSTKAKINLLDDKKKIAMNYPPGEDYYIMDYEVVVAEGQPGWPDFTELDPEAAALPNVATNINNGVGFLGGIVSDTLDIIDECTPVYTDTF